MLVNPTILFIQTMNAISLGMNLFIIAVGLTLIFGVLRIINFAHGAFYMIGAYVSFSTISWLGETDIGFWSGVLAAGLVMAVVAFVLERVLLARLYDKDHILQLLLTFGLVLIAKDAVKIIWGTAQHSISTPPLFKGAVNLGIAYYPAYMLVVCGLGVALLIALKSLIDYSRWGRYVRAARLDREMLSALGTDVKKVYSAIFVLGAMLAAIGGALAAPRSAVDPGMDGLVIIDCFVIVLIGGLGSIGGSFVGALLLGFITVFGSLYLNEWVIVAVYVMLVVTLLVRPRGIFGKNEEERH